MKEFDKVLGDEVDMDKYLKDDAFGETTEVLDAPSNDDPEFVYSIDEETFYDDLDEVMEMLADDMDNEPGDKVTIYRGNPVRLNHYDFIKNLSLVEILQDMAADEDGEMAEDYLMDVSEGDEEKILMILANVLNDYAAQPNYHRVENIQPMIVTIDGIEE